VETGPKSEKTAVGEKGDQSSTRALNTRQESFVRAMHAMVGPM
jgi:hypothetical protein